MKTDKRSGKKGFLITLEGGEGCGKSTQIKRLYRYLKRRGVKVFLTREPGGTKVGDAIRNVLLDKRSGKLSGECETMLYMTARAALVEEVIAPKIKQGHVVLCDRWLDATVAYQGYGEGVDLNWIRSIGRTVTQGLQPKISLYLDLPVKTGLKRSAKHKAADRMELKNIRFHEKVRRGYLDIARTQPRRFLLLRLTEKESVRAVQERIKEAVSRVL